MVEAVPEEDDHFNVIEFPWQAQRSDGDRRVKR
jgi:hypothetical protein